MAARNRSNSNIVSFSKLICAFYMIMGFAHFTPASAENAGSRETYFGTKGGYDQIQIVKEFETEEEKLARESEARFFQERKEKFKSCGLQYPGTPKSPIFRDIQRVALFFKSPVSSKMLKCKGREKKCADQEAALKSFPEQRGAWIKSLTRNIKDYPIDLDPEELTKLFKKSITEKITPYIPPGRECKLSEVKVLTNSDLSDLQIVELRGTAAKDVMIIYIKLDIVEDTSPKIAVLTSYFYRPNGLQSTLRSQIYASNSTAFRLNEESSAIKIRLRKFADSLGYLTSGVAPH